LFRPLGSPGTVDESDEVLASEAIRADGFREASKLFDQHLLDVIDATSVVTGAALLPVGGSTLIEKARGKYVFIKAVRRRPAAHLDIHTGFNTDLLEEAARAARQFRSDRATRYASYYLRLAGLAEALRTITFHALQAAEALCPQPGRSWTDHARLKTLLGNDLYGFFYRRDPILNDTRRNALAHGRLIDEEGLPPITDDLTMRLLAAVRDRLGASARTAFSPVRGFNSYDSVSLFLEPRSDLLTLPELVTMAVDGVVHTESEPRWVGPEITKRLWRDW
jgi:hypothetical protein